jgi:hypothetical protein
MRQLQGTKKHMRDLPYIAVCITVDKTMRSLHTLSLDRFMHRSGTVYVYTLSGVCRFVSFLGFVLADMSFSTHPLQL